MPLEVAPVVARSSSWRLRFLRFVPLLRPLVALVVIVAISYAVVRQWNGVRAALLTLAWPSVLLSLVAALAGTGTSLLSWRALLADEGYRLPVLAAGRIFLVGQLGKYLPGSVWSVVLQMELGRREGLPRGRAFTTSLAWVGLSLSTALTVGVIGLPVLASTQSGYVWWLLVALPLVVAASVPQVLTRLINLLLRLLRKGPLPRPLSWSGVLSACGWLVMTWMFFGVHLWLLANALGAPGIEGLTRSVGGFALAMAAGVLFVVVPSGAGVREAIVVATLAPVMSAGEALGVAVVSRAVFIAADVASAGAAAASGLRQLGRTGTAPSRTAAPRP